jgi:protein involved in polysaccharide export with SLBB domain
MLIRNFLAAGLLATMVACAPVYDLENVPPVPDAQVAPEYYDPPVVEEYRIQIGDVLAVQSYFDPAINQEVFVRPDGRISLILLGDRKVADMTTSDLNEMLQDEYATFIDVRDVNVVVREATGQNVYFGGQVADAGVIPLRGSLTLLQGITSVGGFLISSNQNQVLVVRRQPGGRYKTFQVDADNALINHASDIYLQANDIVYVPKTQIANANEFVEQYLSRMVPDFVRFNFGYQFFQEVGANNNNSTRVIEGGGGNP